ncbi:protein C19orf12 homolog isoform X1 [Chamaea fasciata]|uniref:protein C19orf12 homolog isoform X1 n=2 Tax=Chamaea fasciata TaxID=190680 RepID=UPI003369C4AF
MQQRVMETRLRSEYDEYGWRSEEAGRPVRDKSIELCETPILLESEEPSWEKAPDTKRSMLQWEHRNAGLGVPKYGSASLPMNNSRAETQIRVEDVMALLKEVALVENMYVTYKHARRGAIVAGVSAFVGAVLGGPVGIFIGGAVGGLIGWMTSEHFKSVPQILMELPAAEKQKLCAEVKAFIKNLQWNDARQLIYLVMKNPAVKAKVVGVLTTYLTKTLKAKIRYGE